MVSVGNLMDYNVVLKLDQTLRLYHSHLTVQLVVMHSNYYCSLIIVIGTQNKGQNLVGHPFKKVGTLSLASPLEMYSDYQIGLARSYGSCDRSLF